MRQGMEVLDVSVGAEGGGDWLLPKGEQIRKIGSGLVGSMPCRLSGMQKFDGCDPFTLDGCEVAATLQGRLNSSTRKMRPPVIGASTDLRTNEPRFVVQGRRWPPHVAETLPRPQDPKGVASVYEPPQPLLSATGVASGAGQGDREVGKSFGRGVAEPADEYRDNVLPMLAA